MPEEDYMVDISGKLEQIIKLINDRSYFTINRARQYGKTTTLSMLQKRLAGDYLCASNKQRRAKWVDLKDGKRIFDVIL